MNTKYFVSFEYLSKGFGFSQFFGNEIIDYYDKIEETIELRKIELDLEKKNDIRFVKIINIHKI